MIPLRLEAVGPAARAPIAPAVSGTAPAVARVLPGEALAPLTGTYRGTVSGDNLRGTFSLEFILTVVQTGDQISGTWAAPRGGSGTVSGRRVSSTGIEFRMKELPPCLGEFIGLATIGEGGTTVGGSYEGTGCSGSVKATFTVTRQ
jgi:hypothetical protein